MSQRTLVELNHDNCPHQDEALLEWARKMQAYMRSGDPGDLPRGVIHLGRRHHSYPVEDALDWAKKMHPDCVQSDTPSGAARRGRYGG